MNQSFTPNAPVRSGGSADAPDVFIVLRRYVWLVVLGTLLGTSIAWLVYLYLSRNSPRYTATVTYQVLSPPPPPGNLTTVNSDVSSTQEEISRFIRRQIRYVRSDAVLDRALQSDEFQRDPRDQTGTRKSQWLLDHPIQPKKRLQECVDVAASPTSDLFDINFTTTDPAEAARLVNAIARIYFDTLRNDNQVNQSQHVDELKKILLNQENDVRLLEGKLDDFRKARNVDAIAPRHTLELNVLGQLDTDLVRAESEATAMGAQYESLKSQINSNTFQLSADMEQYIENDPQLRMLEQMKMQLDEDRAVLIGQVGPSSELVRAQERRLATIVQQTNDRRADLRATAKTRTQDAAQSRYNESVARMQYLKKTRDDKDREVRDLDYWLVQAQQRAEELKAQQTVLANLRQQYTMEMLKSATDDTRIRKWSGDASAPSEPSWPMWYRFVPVGFGAGLVLSYGMAYLFELTNTRVRTPNDVTRTLQLPLLGFVPDQHDDAAVTGELSTSIRTSPNSMIAESYRQIRGRLLAQADGKPLKTLLIASIAPGGGATTVACNIANGMALNELRVLLVDANFYRPGLARTYPNISAIGLADVVATPSKLDSAIVPSPQLPNLHLMGTGNAGNATAAEMLEGRGFREILEQLKSRYDIVVFDGAPLSLVSDSIALAGRVDGVVAVVRAGEVSRGTVSRVREQLRHVRASLLGIVLNAAQTHGAGYFKKNYRTFYEYAGRGAHTAGTTAN